jgi:hypothetical protein
MICVSNTSEELVNKVSKLDSEYGRKNLRSIWLQEVAQW